MCVVGKLAVTQVQHERVSGDCFHGVRHRCLKSGSGPGNVVWQPVLGNDYRCICYGKHFFTISMVGADIACSPGEKGAFLGPFPVYCIAPGNLRKSASDNKARPVVGTDLRPLTAIQSVPTTGGPSTFSPPLWVMMVGSFRYGAIEQHTVP